MECPTPPNANQCHPSHRDTCLPLDLVYPILDYVHDDKPALSSCALVSRDWASLTRTHLFRTISIQRHSKFLPFIDFLCSPSSNAIRGLVQRLSIRCYSYGRGNPAIQFDVHTLCTILSHLPLVMELELVRISLLPMDGDEQKMAEVASWVPRAMQAVTFSLITFKWDRHTDENTQFPEGPAHTNIMFEEAFRLFGLFSTVEKMSLESPWLEHGYNNLGYRWLADSSELENLPSLLHLQVRELVADANFCFFEMIRKSGCIHSLRILEFVFAVKDTVVAVQALIYDSSSLAHVRYLTYRDVDDFWEMDIPSVDLSRCQGLQSAYFKVYICKNSVTSEYFNPPP